MSANKTNDVKIANVTANLFHFFHWVLVVIYSGGLLYSINASFPLWLTWFFLQSVGFLSAFFNLASRKKHDDMQKELIKEELQEMKNSNAN